MIIDHGERLTDLYGTAVEIRHRLEPDDPPDYQATVAAWFLDCPGQTPFWRHYGLTAIHLRPIEGVKPAHVRVPGATHEIMLCAYNPEANPSPDDPKTWAILTPVNVMEQIELPSDDDAVSLARDCVRAILDGRLWAEPPLSGQREPWRTTLIKTAAHFRGEVHAP